MNKTIFTLLSNLVPRSRVWMIEQQVNFPSRRSKLNQFFEGLSDMPAEARAFADTIIDDIFPDTTSQLDEWDDQFGLPDVGLTDPQRVTRLDATWSALGGQSPRYLQDVVHANGFADVFIHQWWEVPVIGGVPVARDPRDFLTDGGPQLTPLLSPFSGPGEDANNLGEVGMVLGETSDPLGYPLVNIIRTSITIAPGLGDPSMELSDFPAESVPENLAFLGQPISVTEGVVEYPLPDDPDKWPYFLYFGGETFPDQGSVPSLRRDEFETLLLTLCPGQQWLGVLVDYI